IYLENQLRAWQSGTRSAGPQGLMGGIAGKLSAADIHAVAAVFAAPGEGGVAAHEPRADSATASPASPALRAPPVSGVPSQSSTSPLAPSPPVPGAPSQSSTSPLAPAPSNTALARRVFTPPAESQMPNSEFGKMVRAGEKIFDDTHENASAFVGNRLRCSSCHLDAGRKGGSAPLWAAYVAYPEYRAKNKKVNTFEERLQGCFQYSMNGRAPPLGGPVLVALESYAYWLASGAPIDSKLPGRGYPKLKRPALAADYERGRAIYGQQCALCHGADGAGQTANDGRAAFPALWGDGSFNWGAGMESIANAAAFIRANMPFSRPDTLSVQDAWDVGKYMDSHERPQDPRFVESVATTRVKFHDSADSMYGLNVAGHVLGQRSAKPGGELHTQPHT
ncbi:MAG TPA: c-type cytochrome, partial [Steroidobacteraceae bacterium]